MIAAALAAAVLTAVSTGVETLPRRDALLIAPRPWPAGRTDSPSRAENGRLWISRAPVGTRTPLAEQRFSRRGPAAFGAPADLDDALIYVRVGHTPIAISPWSRFDTNGFERFRDAQNLWLREQGLVLKVRTHVNPMYAPLRTADAGPPHPRATIRRHPDPSAPRFPARLRVEHHPRFRVIEPAPTDTPRTAEVALDPD